MNSKRGSSEERSKIFEGERRCPIMSNLLVTSRQLWFNARLLIGGSIGPLIALIIFSQSGSSFESLHFKFSLLYPLLELP
ncbi:MAG: hypothetical protein ACFFD2_25305 [Promethearchaeota archaeon]